MTQLIKRDALNSLPLLAATHNPWKIAEIKKASGEVAGSRLSIVTAAEIGLPEIDEDQRSFYGNALLKASEAAKYSGFHALADDSGFCIDALNGAPGIYSARRRAQSGEETVDQEIIDQLAASDNRKARFTCVVVLADPAGECIASAKVSLDGHVAPAVRGARKFGYGRIFIPEGHSLTYAEMDASEQDARNPRPQAVKQVLNSFLGL